MSTLALEDIESSKNVTTKQPRRAKRSHDETVCSIANNSKDNYSMTTPIDPKLFNFSRKVPPHLAPDVAQSLSIVLPTPSSIVLPTPSSIVLPAVEAAVQSSIPSVNIPAIESETTTIHSMMHESLSSPINPIVPVGRFQPTESEEVTVQFCEESDDPNIIPGSPTSKKKRRNELRNIFRSCFHTQPFPPSQPNVSDILGENSDPEDVM